MLKPPNNHALISGHVLLSGKHGIVVFDRMYSSLSDLQNV